MNQNDLNNSLCEFARHGILLGVKRCIELGADAKDCYSYALRWSARNGHLEVVKFLLPYSDPKDCDSWVFKLASHNGHLEVVKFLLPHSYPKARDSEALRWAAMNGHLEVVKTIEDYIKENNL